MNNLQKIFNPSLKDRMESAKNYLTWWITFIEDKDCIACKYSESRVDYMHSYKTYVTYCKKYNKFCPHTCDDFDLAKIEVRKRDKE